MSYFFTIHVTVGHVFGKMASLFYFLKILICLRRHCKTKCGVAGFAPIIICGIKLKEMQDSLKICNSINIAVCQIHVLWYFKLVQTENGCIRNVFL
jgi:hypothetical protein